MLVSYCVIVSEMLLTVLPDKVSAPSTKEMSEARERLQSQGFWLPQAGGHKAWLKALCTALLDSGGVRSEALLQSRPLCLVSSWPLPEENAERVFSW